MTPEERRKAIRNMLLVCIVAPVIAVAIMGLATLRNVLPTLVLDGAVVVGIALGIRAFMHRGDAPTAPPPVGGEGWRRP